LAKIGFTLNDYWLILHKRKWIAVSAFLVIFLSVIINTNMQSPVYEASSTIRIIERKSVSDMITQMVSNTSYDIMQSVSKVLTGRPVIEKVVDELGLVDKNTTPETLDGIILSIQGAVETESITGTNIIRITARHSDPVMTAKIPNAIAKVYIKIDMDEKTEHARNMRIFLEDQFNKSKQRLNEVQDKLRAFKERGEVTGMAAILQNDIASLEKEKLQLKKIFTNKYPDIVKMNEQIENLKKQLQTMPASELEYANLTLNSEVTEKEYRELQARLQEARIAEAEKVEDVKIVNPATVPKTPIKPNKQLNTIMGLAVGLVVGIFLSFVIETLDTSLGTIDDLEALLQLPVLAVIPYIKRGQDISTKKWWQLAASRIFKQLKQQKRSDIEVIEDMRGQMLTKFGQKSGTTEAYRILRTNIKVDELKKTGKNVLLITSTIPKEGKSITSVNFALALAQDGYKTLLIDCDLRKAVAHKLFGVDKDPGLTDVLLGIVKPEAAIKNLIDIMISTTVASKNDFMTSGLDNFSLLTCGKLVSNPAEVLDSADLVPLFSNLKKQYDFVVVDSPPILPVPDAITLGTKIADRLYLVYRSGYTSKLALLRAKQQLDIMKATPNGIILNSTTPQSQMVSDYYHHYYQYKYYAEPDQQKHRERKA